MALKDLEANLELMQTYKMLEIAKHTMQDHLDYMSNLYITIREHRCYDHCFSEEDKISLEEDYVNTCNKYATLDANTITIKEKRDEERRKHLEQIKIDEEANKVK